MEFVSKIKYDVFVFLPSKMDSLWSLFVKSSMMYLYFIFLPSKMDSLWSLLVKSSMMYLYSYLRRWIACGAC